MKERIKIFTSALAIFLTAWLMFFACATAQGQNVKRIGNKFVEQPSDTSKKKSQVYETDLLYVDKQKRAYPIFLSSNGKAFVNMVSKKTGKKYRKYLPEITKMLEKDEKSKSDSSSCTKK